MIEDIKKTLWATADKLRANMDAAEYKHVVLGLIFLKYISDAFEAKREAVAQEAARLRSLWVDLLGVPKLRITAFRIVI